MTKRAVGCCRYFLPIDTVIIMLTPHEEKSNVCIMTHHFHFQDVMWILHVAVLLF
ncbi:hypothetical protein PHET_09788 [Paragonimus heterotremus]|uniref:Uncharacterized protein n=1 Tax=Paragonimus heterotremus TaxID=100268 RepID=A0A8J4T3L4_9TREM|nr:hypothetical protein PHET_09788 [Paragonimus heterotremus]